MKGVFLLLAFIPGHWTFQAAAQDCDPSILLAKDTIDLSEDTYRNLLLVKKRIETSESSNDASGKVVYGDFELSGDQQKKPLRL